jgi:hypothetical protein
LHRGGASTVSTSLFLASWRCNSTDFIGDQGITTQKPPA